MPETPMEKADITAGALLKQLREEKNLSLQEVSAKTHLEPRIIEALEANRFDTLPAATYARGYLRSYSKLLGADPEYLISLYNCEAADPPEIIPEVKHAGQTSSRDKPVQAFSYLISFILVLLLIAWWQSDHVLERLPATTPVISLPEDNTVTATIDEEVVDTEIIEETVAPDDELTETTDVINASETKPIDNIASGQDTIGPQALEVTTGPGLIETSHSAAESMPENNDIDQAENYIDRRGEGPDEVVITLHADSWVEVFEADGDKLYLNLARAGQTLILQGTAPMSVLLGFSQGASVTFNNSSFDHAPYSRSGIARFNLGSETPYMEY